MPAMALGAGWSPSSVNAGWDDLRKQVSIENIHFDVCFLQTLLRYIYKRFCL